MTDNITIKRWDTGAVIYDGPRDGLAWRNLYRADLSGTNFSHANLFGTNLSHADLSGADLSYVNLLRANLSLANLSLANLSLANLSYTNLSHADLSGANFRDANLSRANLSYANLSGTEFCTEDGYPCTLRAVWQAGPLGSRGDTLTVFATDRGLMVKTGCFGPAPVKEFLAAVKVQHRDNQHGRAYRAAIECARIALEGYA
jgi:hypothetical protein